MNEREVRNLQKESQYKFRLICDTIGYDDLDNWSTLHGGYRGYKRDMSELDMIFTQEFMDKFLSFLEDKWKAENSYTEEAFIGVHIRILDSLNDPVTYLYNLLGLGEK